MKKSELTFAVLLVPADFLLVFLAAATAYIIRFRWLAAVRPVTFELPWPEFVVLAMTGAGVFVLCFALAGLYAVTGPHRIKSEVSRVFIAGSAAVLALVVTIFFRRELFASRFIILAAWVLALLFVSFGRVAMRLLQRRLLRHGLGTHRILVIGRPEEPTTGLLLKEFAANPSLGYRVVLASPSLDAAAAEAGRLAAAGELDEVIVTDPDLDRDAIMRLLGFAESRHLDFKYAADPLATHSRNVSFGLFAGVPVVEVRGTRLEGWGRLFKRAFDIIGSLVLIILTSPIMLVTAIAIVLDSGFPVFFRQRDDGSPVYRVGEKGRLFTYLKFRSMRPKTDSLRYTELAHLDTRKEGPLVKIKDDPRVTRVGRFIRKYSIDELPELFLVFIGKMSLVGPRPHLPEEVARYQERQHRVLTIKPGITGLAQVSGRSDLDFEDEVKLDTYYIENWSPWLDLAILLKTPFAVFKERISD